MKEPWLLLCRRVASAVRQASLKRPPLECTAINQCVLCPQTRGSIPFYWSQRPNLKYKPKPIISKTAIHVRWCCHHHSTCLFFKESSVNYWLVAKGSSVCVFLLKDGRFPEAFWLSSGDLWEANHSEPGEEPRCRCTLQQTPPLLWLFFWSCVFFRSIRRAQRSRWSRPLPGWCPTWTMKSSSEWQRHSQLW